MLFQISMTACSFIYKSKQKKYEKTSMFHSELKTG